jgi:predicted PurR-regulated permease PerM
MMNAIDPKGQDSQRAAGATALRDTAEVRAVVVTFVALALFVYLIGFIVLPFVIAGIIAYICTPLLDWLAGRTRLPRPLLAVSLFLLLVGLAGFTVAVAGRHLVAEIGSTVTDLQGTLDHPTVSMIGSGGRTGSCSWPASVLPPSSVRS